MPIKPPNLDDRRYGDIVREARSLIPQYCPEWTNLGDADPGMTLVQLFAWMTEMIIYRLNRVPDKTYIHFLNFIGEERREARAAVVPLTYEIRGDAHDVIEIPAFTRNSTRMKEGAEPLHYLTTDGVTVHDANVDRIVAVRAGSRPMVREIPFEHNPVCAKAMLFGSGSGVQFFKMDPVEHGPRAYTPYQYLYVAHDDFRRMVIKGASQPIGRMRIRSKGENLPVGSLFVWEYFNGDADEPWTAIETDEEEEQVLGLPEIALKTQLPYLAECTHFGPVSDPIEIPEQVVEDKHWIRGHIDYERWLTHRMQDDLDITWRDDRGGEERSINNWDVRNTGRNLEFFIQDMPPIRSGWTVRLTLVDRSLPAGRNAYLPKYKWSYRRGERWDVIPSDRVRYQGTSVILTGPFNEMASDGYNLRAERIETVNIRSFIENLSLDMTWVRPIVINLAYGPETGAAAPIPTWELPTLPFQPAPTLPPLLGMKFFIGSDLFENRAGKAVVIELEVGFDLDSTLIEEPKDLYHMQVTYRAADTWRVVYDREEKFAECTFASLDQDPEGALRAARRKIRLTLDPKKQLRGMHRAIIGGMETCWLRLELTRSAMTYQKDNKSPILPIAIKIFGIKLGLDGSFGLDSYEEPMPGPKVATVEYRDENRRLTRVVTRSAGKLAEVYPFDNFIELGDSDSRAKKGGADHHALYMRFDKAFPLGMRMATLFKARGETYLPEGVTVDWEILENAGYDRIRWGRLIAAGEDSGTPSYMMNRSGTLDFAINDPIELPAPGMWIRALFRTNEGVELPPLPPITHVMLNTVEAINLHAFRMEKFSGLGVPHQTIQLRHFPIFVHRDESDQGSLTHPDRFTDIRIYVTEDGGVRKEWRRAPGNSLLTATKDDRVFSVDPTEGSLTFGNGIRGKMLPVGSYNVSVEVYHTVPGDAGNVGAGEVAFSEGFSDVTVVNNLLPAAGGRNAESIEEIIRRAPSVLTSRDRAVTRLDFEIIAKEASSEVARASCSGEMRDDGEVEVVILPHRREREKIPDPFMSAGLKEHVRRYLGKRCLVNVQPVVRLATFQEVDVSITLRLRPNANMIQVRERAKQWVDKFLDAYEGGLDRGGWPFGGTLFAQDFGRMVADIRDVRHVVDVNIYEVTDSRDSEFPGWEKGQGSKVLLLQKADLFVLRKVRVMSEDGEE